MSSGVKMHGRRVGDTYVLSMTGLLGLKEINEATREISASMGDAGALVIDMRGSILTMDMDSDSVIAGIVDGQPRLGLPLVYVVSPSAQLAMRRLCRRLARHGMLRVATCSYAAACRWAAAEAREAQEPALP